MTLVRWPFGSFPYSIRGLQSTENDHLPQLDWGWDEVGLTLGTGAGLRGHSFSPSPSEGSLGWDKCIRG